MFYLLFLTSVSCSFIIMSHCSSSSSNNNNKKRISFQPFLFKVDTSLQWMEKNQIEKIIEFNDEQKKKTIILVWKKLIIIKYPVPEHSWNNKKKNLPIYYLYIICHFKVHFAKSMFILSAFIPSWITQNKNKKRRKRRRRKKKLAPNILKTNCMSLT